MSDMIHSSVIRWFEPKDEMPNLKKRMWGNYEEHVSKTVLASVYYLGSRNVCPDYRYNYDKKCWEYLLDASNDWWVPCHRDVRVEFWAYYPDPVVPCEEEML